MMPTPRLLWLAVLLATALSGWRAQAAEVRSHRGNLRGHPEHTLESYDAVIRAGAQVVEIDVQLTAEGIPICLHDATLDRTTTGTGPSAARTLDDIKYLDAGVKFGPWFAGRRVPTLEEALSFLKPRRAEVLIEPKVDAAARIAAAIAAADYPEDRVELLIFTPGAASTATVQTQYSGINPHWPRWLVANGTPSSLGQARLADLKRAGWDGLSFWPNSFTANDYTLAHSLGLQVGVYGVNAGNVMTYVDEGADLLLTDDPGGLPNSLMNGYVSAVWNRFVIMHGLTPPLAGPETDADADGLSNLEEFVYGSNPIEANGIPPGSVPVMVTEGPIDQREIVVAVAIPPQKMECVWFSVVTSHDGKTWWPAPSEQAREDHTAWPADRAWRFRIPLDGAETPARAFFRMKPHFFPRP